MFVLTVFTVVMTDTSHKLYLMTVVKSSLLTVVNSAISDNR